MAERREPLRVDPLPEALPEVGPWLWAMEETRRGVLSTVAELDQAALDWRGPGGEDNSIGSLLYHLAVVEMSWLYEDLLLESVPDDIATLFPWEHRDADRRLAHIPNVSLAEHLERLSLTRARFLERLTPITAEDWTTPREPEGVGYACTPAWIVFHLVEHEAGHLFQMREIRRRWLARDAL